ncbi:hypothetical protein Y032_0459g1834 [Ancylostoma ceylanicum]|uniref:Uncharacterized protein n=1 Tax=Ancylostoma ceylanicum TaxID=53326 RepID=A0A016WZ15_9BILA|nr:hypothetical protein Y032_0459g1834 [Ancylostoma ceylanicum]
MIHKAHIICIGLVLLQFAAVHSDDSSEENRTDKRRPPSDNSISKENEKKDHPKSLDVSAASATASDSVKSLSGSSDQLTTQPPSLGLRTEEPTTPAPPAPSPEPGPTPAPIPRPPHFTAGSFFRVLPPSPVCTVNTHVRDVSVLVITAGFFVAPVCILAT